MIIAVPGEIKKDKYNVALAPSAVESIRAAGHTILM
jgi:alanine dehydrogenase